MPAVTTYDALSDAAAYIDTGDLDCVMTCTNRLYYQWQDQPNWNAVMQVIGESCQPIEDLLREVQDQHTLAGAEGVQLDYIGELVGLPRGQFSDDELYRLALTAKGASLTSSGTPDELVGIAQILLPNADVTLVEAFPANIIFLIEEPDLDLTVAALVADLIGPVISAGVGSSFSAADPGLVGGWPSSKGAAPPQYTLGQWSSSKGPNPDTSARSLWAKSV
jgi:hypothetical protein